eukprot:19079_1
MDIDPVIFGAQPAGNVGDIVGDNIGAEQEDIVGDIAGDNIAQPAGNVGDIVGDNIGAEQEDIVGDIAGDNIAQPTGNVGDIEEDNIGDMGGDMEVDIEADDDDCVDDHMAQHIEQERVEREGREDINVWMRAQGLGMLCDVVFAAGFWDRRDLFMLDMNGMRDIGIDVPAARYRFFRAIEAERRLIEARREREAAEVQRQARAAVERAAAEQVQAQDPNGISPGLKKPRCFFTINNCFL